MNQRSTSDSGVQARLRDQERRIAAIDALASNRLTEAHRLVLDLLADTDAPIVSGVCRYCGCTELRGCAIAIPPDDVFGNSAAAIARCAWWNDERTVCSNLTCIQRYEREETSVVGDAVASQASRIVVP